MLGACNTCVRLQSKVTSSETTVNSWMIYLFIYLFIYLLFLFIYLFFPFSPLLVCFACFCFVAIDFVFIFYWPIFCCVLLNLLFFFFSFLSLFILHAVFISLCVGLGLIFHCSENKIPYFGVLYKFLSMGMELTVIKELFIILYI